MIKANKLLKKSNKYYATVAHKKQKDVSHLPTKKEIESEIDNLVNTLQIKNIKPAVFCNRDFKGFMLGGSAEVIDDMQLKKKVWLDWWTRYYPEGLEDPDYTLIRMEPTNARFYYKLNQVNFEL